MIPRRVLPLVLERLSSYPAVAVVGPRQSGKTTLARSLTDSYFDLEQEGEQLRLDLEWDRRVSEKKLVVLDEAQAWPEVFPRLRGAIDHERKRFGRFLILGSVSPALMTQVSESLAGRLSLIELTPFLVSELEPSARDRLWLYGGFPDGGALAERRYPQWQRDYLTLLVQRDLPNWGLSARPQTTERLVRMLAAVHGQIWNASQIAKSLGLSYHTVNSYLDYLEGAFLVRRLLPYQVNLLRRQVKSPKLYWRDSGLLHALMNVSDERSLLFQPWVGASWEGFVIEEILGLLAALGHSHQAYFFRSSDQQRELDLVLELAGELWAIEIKLAASPSPSDMGKLDKAARTVGATRRYLISKTSQPSGDEKRVSCHLGWFLERLEEIPRHPHDDEPAQQRSPRS